MGVKMSLLLLSLIKLLRSPRNFACPTSKTFVAPRNFDFSIKTFVFLRETLRSLFKLLRSR